MTCNLAASYFTFFFLNLLVPREIVQCRKCSIRFHSNLHLTFRFPYNTPCRKYLLNCKQLFKPKKEMIRKNCYNLTRKLFFNVTFLSYPNATSILLVGIGNQVARVHWYF